MPQLRKSGSSTKKVPAHTREEGKVPVEEYVARNPSWLDRQKVKVTPREAKVYRARNGMMIFDIPSHQYNQVVSGVKDPRAALNESGVQDWEIPEGQILVGNLKNRTKVPMKIPRKM